MCSFLFTTQRDSDCFLFSVPHLSFSLDRCHRFLSQALAEFNTARANPLFLVQGVWMDEEEVFGADGKGNNLWQHSTK